MTTAISKIFIDQALYKMKPNVDEIYKRKYVKGAGKQKELRHYLTFKTHDRDLKKHMENGQSTFHLSHDGKTVVLENIESMVRILGGKRDMVIYEVTFLASS